MKGKTKLLLLFTSVLLNSVFVIYMISIKTENESPASKLSEISWKEHSRLDSAKLSHTSKPGLNTDSLFKLYDGVETFVMFIGYPRSSHSLVGAILDAHPEIIIPHEYDVIAKWKMGLSPKKLRKYVLFYELHQLSMTQAMFGIRASANDTGLTGFMYTYNVPGLWQGGFQQRIKVIGDKKGGGTARGLMNQIGILEEINQVVQVIGDKKGGMAAMRLLNQTDILEEIKQVIQVPMKFIHVTRNPFDNIATIMLRDTQSRDAVRKEGVKINNITKLDEAIDLYFQMAASNQRVRERYGDSVLDIPGHETVLRPRETLLRLCDHLGVTCSEDYIEKCIKILFGTPSVTRNTVVWTEEQKVRVTEMMKDFPFLNEYSFDKYPS